MNLGNLIKNYRAEHNLSQRNFAKLCNLSHTYIAALEKNIDSRTGKPIAPTLDTVKYISNAMNITIDEILKILDDEQEFNMQTEAPQLYYKCPVYGKISAGNPNWAEESQETFIPLDPDIVSGLFNVEDCFFLRVNGESMNKIIKNGSFALIRKQSSVENGEIAVVLVNGFDATLKKFTKQKDLVILEPLSTDSSFETQVYNKSTEIKIIGKYVGKFEIN